MTRAPAPGARQAPPADAQHAPDKRAAQRRYDSQDLFGPAVEIEIEHQQQVYRLRRTSLGKLILTK
jgi:hemin uptake protein HemP